MVFQANCHITLKEMKNEIVRIIAFGDIIGSPGRHALKAIIPALREKHSPDLVIANGENLAHN